MDSGPICFQENLALKGSTKYSCRYGIGGNKDDLQNY